MQSSGRGIFRRKEPANASFAAYAEGKPFGLPGREAARGIQPESRSPGRIRFSQELCELLRIRRQNKEQCRKLAARLLDCINELCQSPFKAMSSLGRTLVTWKEEIARMFRFSKNNGITEGFYRKMKLIQRRAYGFWNFENYRLRVRVLCG